MTKTILSPSKDTVSEMREIYHERCKTVLRKLFDSSLTPNTALAVIEITKEQGFIEDAEEMIRDLKI